MIYLDHAAATPVSAKALSAMLPYFSDNFFNPSAPYLPAKQTREQYDAAKSAIARAIGAKAPDLVITAGATESINLAFTAVEKTAKVLTLSTEHAAVLAPAAAHPHEFVKVDRHGLIDLADFKSKLAQDVQFVSVSLANNELGTIQPLAEIAALIKKERNQRRAEGNQTPLYLHSDASQALNLLDVNVARLGIDLLTLNAAKVYGPKGVGALYVAHGIVLHPLTVGGGQEQGLRSGTENVPGVIGFATALTEAKSHLMSNRKKSTQLANLLRTELTKNLQSAGLPAPVFLGSPKHQLANFVPVAFPGLDAERLIYKLEADGILVATGAACAARKGEKSHVLAAIGLTDVEIAGSLRLTLGATNTEADIKTAATKISAAVQAEYVRLGDR